MRIPKTSDDVKTEILISSDKPGDLRIRQLIHILPKIDSEVLIEGVIKVIETENRPDSFRDQECVGKILETINPKSQKDIVAILNRTIKNWDKSIEQFPFWLSYNYGIEKVKEVFDTIQLTEFEKDKIETMKYWLQIKLPTA